MSAKKKKTPVKAKVKKVQKAEVKTLTTKKKIFHKNIWIVSGIVFGIIVCLAFIFVKPLLGQI